MNQYSCVLMYHMFPFVVSQDQSSQDERIMYHSRLLDLYEADAYPAIGFFAFVKVSSQPQWEVSAIFVS